MSLAALDVRVELLLGSWITVPRQLVLGRDKLAISRGTSSEGSQGADPSTAKFTLNNQDGWASPRNPLGPYFELLGRNTQCRASLPYGASYLRLPGEVGDYIYTPDSAGLSITGDLDVRIDLTLDNWFGQQGLAGKWISTGNQRSWALELADDGIVSFFWSANGSTVNQINSTQPIAPGPHERMAIRVTIDVNNGSSGKDVKFYTAPVITAAWTQLGSTVTTSGTTSIFDSTAITYLGYASAASSRYARGKCHAFKVLQGIGGTERANPDFATLTPGTTSFTDAAGNIWARVGGTIVDDRLYRFWGELSDLPLHWNTDGSDVWVPATVSGIFRRLTQGASPLRSSMFREHTNPARANIVAYWPCEDEVGATTIASGLPGQKPMRIDGTPTLAAMSEWTSSGPLPNMGTGKFTGVFKMTATGKISARTFLNIGEPNVAAETSLLHLVTTGTARFWDLRVNATGDLRTRAYDGDDVSLLDNTTAFLLNTRGFCIIDLELTQNGANVDWAVRVVDFTNTDRFDDPFPVVSTTGTVTGKTIGRGTTVTIGRDQGLGTGVTCGHVAVADDINAFAGTTAAIAAHSGESPTARIRRLCAEEGLSYSEVNKGEAANTVQMGDQKINPLKALLDEAATTDLGVLYEPRDRLGVSYRTRTSLYNQPATVTLDYAAQQLAPPLEPVDDDQTVRNDITVQREGGSKYPAEQTTGPLSTQPPPGGVGRYDTSVTVSLVTDDLLPDQAGWRLHLGTVDEPRYPQVSVNFSASAIREDTDLAAALLALDIGDRIEIINPPSWLPPDPISLLIDGYTETLSGTVHTIVFNCSPESPYQIAVADDADKRADTDGSVTSGAFVAGTSTSMTAVTASGPLWTTNAASMPFRVRVSGVVLEVTAVSGASSPQTFTVTAAPVNGVIKTIPSGSAINVAYPAYAGM